MVEILKEDNTKMQLSLSRRYSIEKDVFLMENKNKSLLFQVCTLNFLRACLDGYYGNTFAYCHSLSAVSEAEIKIFLQVSFINNLSFSPTTRLTK